ncbi:DUF2147 domain-containing protein [Qipengyuania sp. DY56-A-20]|jgi:uncharacterized protein (DUF2147 family)|uniref:DUF2147 domain-containing protein n=1 Tax=Qipengyuania benthica TaxID=3067651 RepID=A0ABT9H4M4_9SPHN|nr:DUF2147 domain-containing protein [Qipengyuania sp. DY56-A-20]MBU1254126.1 DUF2147 domain-containing protein [Alphaproteobacteria bacterium]MBU1605638.1 DUF2147 domain-containing protein [Alphaproteobacteria bacterium]MDP4538274.1 DUF2147 domain-containing protein [Qipengyuania sp. DY56-A-20]
MKFAATALAATAALTAVPALAAAPIAGNWITEEKDAVVAVGRCGQSLCGKISRFLKPPPEGAGQRDVNNPDPAKRSRRILGLPVLTSFSEDGDVWRGRIYDPKSGKDYRSVVRRLSSGKLEVKGCLGPFCQTQVWTKAD